MIPENVTEKVNREERRDTQKIEMAVAAIRRTLAGRIPVETALETHGQILRAVAIALRPNVPAPEIKIVPGEAWFMLNQFTRSLRSVLRFNNPHITLGDLLAEIDRRLPPSTGSHNSPSHPQSHPDSR